MRVVAYRDAMAGIGATQLRMPFATTDAITLAGELVPEEIRHPEAFAKGIEAWDALGSPPAGDAEKMLTHGAAMAKAADAFWNAFEGQVVDGVEIIRRRA